MDHAQVPGRYLQHIDGTWSIVDLDGWPIPIDELDELCPDALSAIAAMTLPVIDMELILSPDSEIR
ncbi:hypothetical protein [Nocardia sp. CNY236]|uniref:hypothetical protein n=1 Tax=Nocardia sp. CNY236 TaxID=1169152 RepID=UPI0004916975|nr:hypothetical protein [Nocardia sp. CNY236]